MTTINTIEDLIQILDEHPRWLEALRARLLTRELIELPEKFARVRRNDPTNALAPLKPTSRTSRQMSQSSKRTLRALKRR